MNKKSYIQPELTEIRVRLDVSLLIASDPTAGIDKDSSTVNPSEIESRFGLSDWGDDEE